MTAFSDANNGQARFSSGEQRVALIELYTSEGCSSCPPADRWLSNLKDNPRLWKDFAPIALHVDYWDYIGWNDRFGSSEYSERQRGYVLEGGASVVYTPGFFRDGQEWRGWRRGAPVASDRPKSGKLDVLVDGQQVIVNFGIADAKGSAMTAHVALLGMNLETRVRAGENQGRTLRHDFVALGVESVPLETSAAGYKAVASLPETDIRPRELAVLVWVSEAGRQEPIQSAGGYLPFNR